VADGRFLYDGGRTAPLAVAAAAAAASPNVSKAVQREWSGDEHCSSAAGAASASASAFLLNVSNLSLVDQR
jgi:hypothetical protein